MNYMGVFFVCVLWVGSVKKQIELYVIKINKVFLKLNLMIEVKILFFLWEKEYDE